jgi:hypothetical protein
MQPVPKSALWCVVLLGTLPLLLWLSIGTPGLGGAAFPQSGCALAHH